MIKPAGIALSAVPPAWAPVRALLCVLVCAGTAMANPPAAPAASAAAPPVSPSAPQAAPAVARPAQPVDIIKARFKQTGPLKRLIFSAREGFSLKMVSNQDVTAEIRNGAGRTLARTAYTLEAGDWTLRPRNLPPGLYTVLLRTGSQLRSMRMKIEDSERGKGSPEWVLEKVPDSTRVIDPSAQRGASVFPARDFTGRDLPGPD